MKLSKREQITTPSYFHDLLSKQPRDRTYTRCIVCDVYAIAYCLHQHLACIVSFIL